MLTWNQKFTIPQLSCKICELTVYYNIKSNSLAETFCYLLFLLYHFN